jgi:hypothetical protein
VGLFHVRAADQAARVPVVQQHREIAPAKENPPRADTRDGLYDQEERTLVTKKTIARQRGAHRPEHKGLLRFTDWYREHTGHPFLPRLHREANADTTVLPSFIAPLETRIAELEALGVHVTVDPHFTPEECDWCMIERRLATVRVYGDPMANDLENPLTVTESCHQCALSIHGPVRQARIEQNPHSRNEIRVELCE